MTRSIPLLFATIAGVIFYVGGSRELFSGPERIGVFEGVVVAKVTRVGVEPTQLVFSRHANLLRIENDDTRNPEPINLVDLDSKRLTIIFPHNSTFVHVDLTKAPSRPGALSLPPDLPAASNSNTVGKVVDVPETTASLSADPKIPRPPAFAIPPPFPSTAQMPDNPMISGLPMMPMAGPSSPPELKKMDKTRKIQGFECACYTLGDRMGTFEIWATPDSALFPFRWLERTYNNRHFGPMMLEEHWVELLQKNSLFPLEATLRMEGSGGERLSFKVEKIEKKKIDEKLFQVPERFYEIEARRF